MEEVGNYILSALIGGGGVYGLFTWLGKKWVDKRVSKELDAHREDLKRTTNELQEKLRIEYNSLYNNRIKAIEKLHSILLTIIRMEVRFSNHDMRYAGQYAGEDETNEYNEIVGNLISTILQFEKTLNDSELYFTDKDWKTIKRLSDSLRSVYTFNVKHHYYDLELQQYMKKEGLAIVYSEENKALSSEVIAIFRKLVGVKDE
ncbi:MAG: hypothetical protein SNJ29_16460 [Rikenellaceae bacterium]